MAYCIAHAPVLSVVWQPGWEGSLGRMDTCMCLHMCSLMSDFLRPMDWGPPGSSVLGVFQARNTGVGCHFLLQGIFLTQGSNSCLLSMKRNTLNTDSDTQPYRGFRGLIQETVHICQKVQQIRSEDALENPITL